MEMTNKCILVCMFSMFLFYMPEKKTTTLLRVNLFFNKIKWQSGIALLNASRIQRNKNMHVKSTENWIF